jgi:hypothetical protein
MAKKISDEEELMNQSSTNLRKKSKNSKKMKTKSASRQSSQVEGMLIFQMISAIEAKTLETL